mgnify:CR=1 FL=1
MVILKASLNYLEEIFSMTDANRPNFIKHYSEIQEPDNSCYKTSNSEELLSIGSPFGKAFGLKRLGIHHEFLPPGRRTSWPHAEKTEEEFVYVIEGNPDVWIDGHLYRLNPGDGVGFIPGTGISDPRSRSDRDTLQFRLGERTGGGRHDPACRPIHRRTHA